jgi:hypothetical protein
VSQGSLRAQLARQSGSPAQAWVRWMRCPPSFAKAAENRLPNRPILPIAARAAPGYPAYALVSHGGVTAPELAEHRSIHILRWYRVKIAGETYIQLMEVIIDEVKIHSFSRKLPEPLGAFNESGWR